MHEETDILLDSYGILKVDERTYNSLDKQYILRVKKRNLRIQLSDRGKILLFGKLSGACSGKRNSG